MRRSVSSKLHVVILNFKLMKSLVRVTIDFINFKFKIQRTTSLLIEGATTAYLAFF